MMPEAEVAYTITRGAVAFIGIAFQLAAVFWVWRDWTMSQYQHQDWKKLHRQDEAATRRSLSVLWSKFAGPASGPRFDLDNASAVELDDLSKMFPSSGDDEELKVRKIDHLTSLYGIGPSAADLSRMGEHLEFLATCRRGIGDYRIFVRRTTFHTALWLISIGLVLQLYAAWPERWTVASEPAAHTTEK